MGDNDKEKYRSDFVAWSDRLEKLILRSILVLIVLLGLTQLALQYPAARHWLTTTDDSEGVPFHYQVR
ncbi:hypothetical protein [Cohnella cholangitidis]|uniref:Uncharacterized protein n=1 Tax=Cohnella cholangitidis TaxID=2598458 RepID=A0A7G5C570_9BACL|nr:hypothetical protein [Cohnella cholangitidis]QMV44354.1 hypothetical protein FPL14_26695 [Cohnella cholangitidis]